MYLLIPVSSDAKVRKVLEFTFHNVSINSGTTPEQSDLLS